MWLGLWLTKVGQDESQDLKKPSWFVMEAAGTSKEDSVFAAYLPTIGVNSWSATFNPLVGEVMPQKVVITLASQAAPLRDANIYFNAEMHKSDVTGSAIFYNVATHVTNRTYKILKNGQLIWPPVGVSVTDNLNLNVDLDAIKNLKLESVNSSAVKLTWEDHANFEKKDL